MTRNSHSSTTDGPIVVSVHRALDGRDRESIMPGDRLQEGGKLGIHGGGEPFARIPVLTLGVTDLNVLLFQIDAFLGNAGLGESATEMKLKLEGRSHPVNLLGQLKPSGTDLRLGDFSLFLGDGERDACQGDTICLSMAAPDRLTHEEGEELHLHAGGVVTGMVTGVTLPPVEVVLGVLVGNLARVADPILVQEDMDRAPEELGTSHRAGVLVVVLDVVGNPLGEITTAMRSHDGLLTRASSRFLESLCGVLRVIMTELQILLLPVLGHEIAEPDIEERRPLFFYEVSHAVISST